MPVRSLGQPGILPVRGDRRRGHDHADEGHQEQDDEPAVEGEERGDQGGRQHDRAGAEGHGFLADPSSWRAGADGRRCRARSASTALAAVRSA